MLSLCWVGHVAKIFIIIIINMWGVGSGSCPASWAAGHQLSIRVVYQKWWMGVDQKSDIPLNRTTIATMTTDQTGSSGLGYAFDCLPLRMQVRFAYLKAYPVGRHLTRAWWVSFWIIREALVCSWFNKTEIPSLFIIARIIRTAFSQSGVSI